MLSSQLKLNLSYYSDLYDRIIPKDHILRKINDIVDFSFVYKSLKVNIALIMDVVQKARYFSSNICF